MPEIKRSNPKCIEQITAHLRELDGKIGRVGFLGTKYDDGKSVAEIAAVQEFGAVIQHPGGTPYKIGHNGQAVFVNKSEGGNLPKTRPHEIVIPPRPFMRPTVADQKQNWFKIMENGAKLVIDGKATAGMIFTGLVQKAAADIKTTISNLQSPSLKRSTVRKRLNRKSDKKTLGLLEKPLIDSGKMLESVLGVVEDE